MKARSVSRPKFSVAQHFTKYRRAYAPTCLFKKRLPLITACQLTQSPKQWKLHNPFHELRERGCTPWGWRQGALYVPEFLLRPMKKIRARVFQWRSPPTDTFYPLSGRVCWAPHCLAPRLWIWRDAHAPVIFSLDLPCPPDEKALQTVFSLHLLSWVLTDCLHSRTRALIMGGKDLTMVLCEE